MQELPDSGGGYLVGADDVVQAYNLPRAQYAAGVPKIVPQAVNASPSTPPAKQVILQTMDLDEADVMEDAIPITDAAAPRTMEALAEDLSREPLVGGEAPEAFLVSPPSGNGAERRTSPAGKKAKGTAAKRATAESHGVAPARRASGRKRGRKAAGDSDASEGEAPRKRVNTRVRGSPAKAAAPAAPPTRTLRSRKIKTAEQIEQERENELAYRLAIAE